MSLEAELNLLKNISSYCIMKEYSLILNSNNRANPTDSVNNAIYNFDWSALEEGEYQVTWGFTKTLILYTPYFNFKTYNSYHNGNPSFTDITNAYSSGYSQNSIDLTTGVNNTLVASGSSSVLWTGYFYTGTTPTGIYTFFTNSDDGSYSWLGETALSGYTTTNVFINNGGSHAPVERFASITLTINTYYPIRILYGDSGGGRTMLLSFTPPDTLVKTSDGLGRYFH